MSFTSANFLFFVFLSACVYFLFPKERRWIVLLLSSYTFYLLSSPKTFIFVLFTTITTFYCGKAINSCEDDFRDQLAASPDIDRAGKKALKESAKKRKRKYMLLALLMNFGILAVLKYFKVYLNLLGDKFDISWMQFDAGIMIPLGISFYTFQSMSYIIDLYRAKYEAEKSLPRFALFVSFFPTIVQGPISRFDQLANQLFEGHPFDYKRVKFGAQLVLWGLFKKLVIADRTAILVNTIFDNYVDYSGFIYLTAALGYTIQIYADFSGGMDIARGVAQVFGIEIELNFERPYFAKSVSEFWRRWHITLGHWCRDYIFYPISLSKTFGRLGKKSRKVLGDRIGKMLPVIIAQLITFFIIGIWHGAQLKFIAYGIYQAIFIVGGMIFEPQLAGLVKIFRIKTDTFSYKLFLILRTFVIIVFGRFFSRADSFGTAIYMMKKTFVFNPGVFFSGKMLTLGLSHRELVLLGGCMLFWLSISFVQEKGYGVREFISEQNIAFRWLVYIIGIMSILIFGVYGVGYDASTFIYRGF